MALVEAREDVRAVHDQLRDVLPVLIDIASDTAPEWPDSLLGDVAVTVAKSITRLDAAAGLLSAPGSDD